MNEPGNTSHSASEFQPPKVLVPPPVPAEAIGKPAVLPKAPLPMIVDEESENLQSLLFKRKRNDAEMDMTPMVDVVFLLLIFFMITAAFGVQKSIEIPASEEEQNSQQGSVVQQPEKREQDIVVRVTKENRIFVEEEEAASRQELLAKLRNCIHTGQRTNRLLIIAETAASHESVVRALDAGNIAGMDDIRIQTTH